jgi:hypothetical protein
MDADDELDHLSNVCADLVSLKRLEPGLVHLFRDKPAGAWVPVVELFTHAGADASDIPAGLSVAWMASATDSGYGVVSFYDDDRKWSTSAVYNVARLLRAVQPVAAA